MAATVVIELKVNPEIVNMSTFAKPDYLYSETDVTVSFRVGRELTSLGDVLAACAAALDRYNGD